MKVLRLITGAAVAISGAACADFGAMPAADAFGGSAAFESVPAGFSSTSSSFDAAGDLGDAFHPHRGPGGDRRGHGRHNVFGFLMGGGIGREFLGEIGFGPGKGRGPFHMDSVGSSCVFASSTGIVTCGPVARGGLAILTTAAITTADGTAQARIDSATNTVILTSEVSGSKTRRGSATSELAHRSTRTITGLAKGSAMRSVDGASVGTETTRGTTDEGAFEAVRTVNDTTAGVIIPLVDGRQTYPSAGRVSRNMSVTVTIEGTTTTHTRREVVTYDGTSTAAVVITQDGTTKACRLPLPRGKLVCN